MTLLFLVALPKVLESVAEGEDKETDNSEEKIDSKSSVKEEGEVSELKEETPELKVTALSATIVNRAQCDTLFFFDIFQYLKM